MPRRVNEQEVNGSMQLRKEGRNKRKWSCSTRLMYMNIAAWVADPEAAIQRIIRKGFLFLTVRAYRGVAGRSKELREKRSGVSQARVNQIIEKQRYSLPSVTFS
jgi:hypothetical protein